MQQTRKATLLPAVTRREVKCPLREAVHDRGDSLQCSIASLMAVSHEQCEKLAVARCHAVRDLDRPQDRNETCSQVGSSFPLQANGFIAFKYATRSVLMFLPDSIVGRTIVSKYCRSCAVKRSARMTLSGGAHGCGELWRNTSHDVTGEGITSI